MNPIVKKLMASGNKMMSALYRRSNGKIGGKAKAGLPVILLTVPGRKTGEPRTAPICYFKQDDSYIVVGSAGGMKPEPQWVRNLAAAGGGQVRNGADQFGVTARFTEGAEWEHLWNDVVIAKAPFFADYATKSGRVLPIAILTPN